MGFSERFGHYTLNRPWIIPAKIVAIFVEIQLSKLTISLFFYFWSKNYNKKDPGYFCHKSLTSVRHVNCLYFSNDIIRLVHDLKLVVTLSMAWRC